MTTEDYCFSTKKKKSDSCFNDSSKGKYSNFNLNRGHKYSQDLFGVTKSTKLNLKNDRYKFSGAFGSFKEEKQKSLFGLDKSWKTSYLQKQHGLRYSNFSNFKDDKKSKNASDSRDRGFSFSDYIQKNMHLYESPVGSKDDGIVTFKKDKKKFKDAIGKVLCPSSDLQALWEFPRQQEDAVPREPDVMHFTASQKLLNPNQNVESTIRIKVDEEGLLQSNVDVGLIGKEFEGQQTKKMFTILSEIGSGSFGTVYQCKDEADKLYAIKCVDDEDDFKMEKEILMKATEAKTKHICRLHDFGEADQKFFIVVDLLGSTLEKVLMDRNSEEWIDEVKWKVAEQVLIGLQNLHELGFLHLDLHPRNVAMGLGENVFMAFLIDFGASIKFEKLDGSREYSSTAARDVKKLGPMDDLKSFLYLILEMFHGQLPWTNVESSRTISSMKEDLRKEHSNMFKDIFGEPTSLFGKEYSDELTDYKKVGLLSDDRMFPELVKLMRYIDSLKEEEVPDYNRILYFLQCGYKRESQKAKIKFEMEMKKLKIKDKKKEMEDRQKKFDAKEEEIKQLSMHCRSDVKPLQNVAFLSGYKNYEEHRNEFNPEGKMYNAIEYNGIRLTLNEPKRSRFEFRNKKERITVRVVDFLGKKLGDELMISDVKQKE